MFSSSWWRYCVLQEKLVLFHQVSNLSFELTFSNIICIDQRSNSVLIILVIGIPGWVISYLFDAWMSHSSIIQRNRWKRHFSLMNSVYLLLNQSHINYLYLFHKNLLFYFFYLIHLLVQWAQQVFCFFCAFDFVHRYQVLANV